MYSRFYGRSLEWNEWKVEKDDVREKMRVRLE